MALGKYGAALAARSGVEGRGVDTVVFVGPATEDVPVASRLAGRVEGGEAGLRGIARISASTTFLGEARTDPPAGLTPEAETDVAEAAEGTGFSGGESLAIEAFPSSDRVANNTAMESSAEARPDEVGATTFVSAFGATVGLLATTAVGRTWVTPGRSPLTVVGGRVVAGAGDLSSSSQGAEAPRPFSRPAGSSPKLRVVRAPARRITPVAMRRAHRGRRARPPSACLTLSINPSAVVDTPIAPSMMA
jgi:hypothetical protein